LKSQIYTLKNTHVAVSHKSYKEKVKSFRWFNDCHNILKLCRLIFLRYRRMQKCSWKSCFASRTNPPLKKDM